MGMSTTGMSTESWRQRTEWPMIGASIVFLSAYAFSVLAQPTGTSAYVAATTMTLTWGLFAVDFFVRLALAEQRGQWLLRHLHELAMVVLPLLRPLKLLRLVTLFGVLQRSVGTALRGRVVSYAAGSTILLILVSSLAMLDAERAAPDAGITTYPDALWWSTVTVTTVGYGDYAPVTTTGRVIAVGLMVAGIALLGVVTATLASYLVQRIGEEDEANQAVTREHIVGLTAQIETLRAEVSALRETRLTELAGDR
ncbi:two pore domain potassium channel family protein [Rhodococcus spongiicola]|uniref:Two pore domain potassium channel family protein n=2 Tax=Rhodococcus spongiicola TaxID=2487352 RepID=A0A3S3B9W2_9NOCA|nr:two pore domain potassium channel family protein [Rhodococcus spongiicola]